MLFLHFRVLARFSINGVNLFPLQHHHHSGENFDRIKHHSLEQDNNNNCSEIRETAWYIGAGRVERATQPSRNGLLSDKFSN